jgi:hypothetical protein
LAPAHNASTSASASWLVLAVTKPAAVRSGAQLALSASAPPVDSVSFIAASRP